MKIMKNLHKKWIFIAQYPLLVPDIEYLRIRFQAPIIILIYPDPEHWCVPT